MPFTLTSVSVPVLDKITSELTVAIFVGIVTGISDDTKLLQRVLPVVKEKDGP